MKAKITRGKGFRGVFDYILGKGEIIGGTTSGETPRELAREYGAVRRLREDIKTPVWHSSLSLPQGENLTDDTWRRVVASYLTQVGVDIEQQQYTIVRHSDTEHDHVHIIVNRVGLDKSVWSPRFDVFKAIEATQRIEKNFGLQQTPGRENQRLGEPSVSKGEVLKAVREERLPLKVYVGEAVKRAVEGRPTMTQFLERMSEQGVFCRPNISKTGRVSGFSFCALGYEDGTGAPVPIKGSDAKAGWKNLCEVVDYDAERDFGILKKQADTDYTAWKSRADGSHTGDGIDSHIDGNTIQHSSPEGTDSRRGSGEAHRGPGAQAAKVVGAYRSPAAGHSRHDHSLAGGTAGGGEGIEPVEMENLGMGSSDDSWLDGHIAAAGRIAALAGRTDVPDASTADGAIMSRSLELKKREVLKQLNALGCDQYRITCKARREGLVSFNMCRPKYNPKKEPRPDEVLFTRDSLDWLPEAEKLNTLGYDIYLTPVDASVHTFLVDDLTEDGLKKAVQEYTVAWAQKSSENNFQALILVPNPGDTKLERRAANKMIQKLNLELGGDARLQGVRRPFRTVAFQNKKPGKSAWTKEVYSTSTTPRAFCPRATAELEAIRQEMANEEPERQKKKAMLKTRHRQVQRVIQYRDAVTSPEKHFQRRWKWHYERAVAKVQAGEWKRVRYELIDYAAAKDLIEDGLDPREVLQALQRQSPGLQAGEMDSQYARGTVEAVVQREAATWTRRQARTVHPSVLRYAGRLARAGKGVLSAGVQEALEELEQESGGQQQQYDGR